MSSIDVDHYHSEQNAKHYTFRKRGQREGKSLGLVNLNVEHQNSAGCITGAYIQDCTPKLVGTGTGGTIAGISCALKERNGKVQIYLVDPPGSGMYNKVTRGVMFAKEEAEQKRLKNPTDTITEGVGINRLTANFERYELSAQI